MGIYFHTAEQKTKYVPQMTANTQDGYTATSSTQIWGDTQAWYAFFVSTQGGTDYPFHSPSIGAGNWAWSEIQLPEGLIVNNIEIGARKNYSGTQNLRPIAAFSLKGSNDGNTWTELKAVSGLGDSWSMGSVQNWDIEGQTTAYTYLKLEVQAKSSYVAFDYWNINGVLKEDKELKTPYIGVANFATQGPCDKGFHVPTPNDWLILNTMGETLGAWGSSSPNNLSINLKMPFTGWCDENFGTLANEGARMTFRSAEHGASGKGKLLFTADTTNIYSGSDYTISRGACIRPFKDTPLVPDSSWTKTYSGTGDAGIYHNSTLGLLSISSDGTTWITIADKNLGATTVWNSGDTLSQNNCGKFYQRGNNYGFSHSGAGTTSSTQVNASTYGPGNYYNSSTFITWQPRDSSDNYNLRGGEDGNVSTTIIKTVTAIYIGSQKVRPTGWMPGANTLAYYPLDSINTVNDKSGNNRNLTNNGTYFGTYAGVDCAYLQNTDTKKLYGTLPLTGNQNFTINAYINRLGDNGGGGNGQIFLLGNIGSAGGCLGICIINNNAASNKNKYKLWTWGDDKPLNKTNSLNTRYMITVTNNNGSLKMYENGVEIGSVTISFSINSTNFTVGSFNDHSIGEYQQFYGYLSKLIIENKVWTQQDITDYYNLTKGDYGL